MEQQIRQVVDELFQVYDRNYSGSLDSKELCGFLLEALKRLGIKTTISDVQAQEALKYIDKDRDGQVSKFQVSNALMSIVKYKRNLNNPAPNNINTNGPSQPSYLQNNGWGPSPPTQNNGWSNPQQTNNGWGPAPPSQNGWGPSPSNPWSAPQNNSWNPPTQPNNAWGQPQQNLNGWGPSVPTQPIPNNGWGIQHPASQQTWLDPPRPQGNQNDWKGTQFHTEEDLQLKKLIDKLYLRYDRDRSGCLDRSQLTKAFNHLLEELGVGMRITHSQAARLLQQVDSSNDGKVQKPEFYQMLKFLLSGADDY